MGIAVSSLDEAIPIWEAIVGAPAEARETIGSQGVEVVFLGTGAARIELLAPTSPTSPVARFLERRGPGLHHVCYRVPDITNALATFAESSFELIDREPRRGAHGHRVAFLHPRSAGGVLVELVEGG